MNIKITNKIKNELLHRFEIEGEVTFDAITPSNSEIAAAVAKETGVAVELVVPKQILNEFSQKKAVFTAVAYENEAAKDKTEKLTKHQKKAIEEAAKKAAEEKKKAEEEAAAKKAEEEKAAAEAAAAAEQPAEESKEESAEEEAPAAE